MSAPIDLHLLPGGTLWLPDGSGLSVRHRKAFSQSTAAGLLAIAADAGLDENAPPALRYWASFGREYLNRLAHARHQEVPWLPISPPEDRILEHRVDAAPPAPGMEYLSISTLRALWLAIDEETRAQVVATDGGLEAWLKKRHPLWRLVGRVTFHLAENPRNDQYPFAFLATYTHRLSAQSQLQYLPLGRALKQYADAEDTRTLQTLLTPVQRAADLNGFAHQLLESRQVFQALPWKPEDAYRFLEAVPALEEAGIIAKAPDWWSQGRPSRPVVQVKLDPAPSSPLGTNALLRFSIDVALDGEPLSPEEWERLLEASGNLISLKGQWVEVDREKLQQALEAWKLAQRATEQDGVPFLEGMRLLAGFGGFGSGETGFDLSLLEGGGDWSKVVAGDQLKDALMKMLSLEGIEPVALSPDELRADLRPYQQAGLNWLMFLARLGIGACLADDMGLGKTVQVIAALVALKRESPDRPSLLIVPASLVGNWATEVEKFAPQLSVLYAHPSRSDVTPFTQEKPANLRRYDLVVTTYSMLRRLPALATASWQWLILDEAQAIKNPATTQTRSVKALTARHRIALTGTPIENSVTDLWSLFDFLNPGLLGSASQFKEVMKSGASYEGLRRLVKPYILRRLKTDPTIIRDLPDKTEVLTTCFLAKSQAALYAKAVSQMEEDLKDPDLPEIQRKGLVVSTLIRLKQICNHPGLITGSGNFEERHSGKLGRLRELAEEISSRGEKVIVFSQFREMIGPLAEFLEAIFGRQGLVLHGGTAVNRRQKLVEQFQSPTGAPFFVISLKAGGTGLNLTAATHVIHFDRWWNPAVENQATDRAYRIGQKRNVLVHKFLCPGTIEEKIDEMISSKQQISDELIGDPDGESTQRQLTEMSATELIRFVSLDVRSAINATAP